MRLAAAVGLAAALAAEAAHAAPPRQVLLISGQTRLSAEPPLLPDVTLQATRWHGRIRSDERVVVAVDGRGRPVSVRVRQRLVVGGKGDYVFAVPAPATDVRAAPGSASEPGLRTDLVLWQGFSPGGRILAADVMLDAARAAAALPLRVRVARTDGAVQLTIENATSLRATAPTGLGRPAELRRILAHAGSLRPGEQVYATLAGTPAGRSVRVEAPFRVRGALVFPAGALSAAGVTGGSIDGDEIRFAGVLGGGSPLRLRVTVRGARGTPRLRLRAVPEIPPALLRAPARLDTRALLARTTETLLRAARVVQYREYLANPDPQGAAAAAYEYRTAPARPAAKPSAPSDTAGNAWRIAAIAIGTTVGAMLLAIAWAHS